MQKAAPQSSTCGTMILVSKVMPYTVYLYYPVVSTRLTLLNYLYILYILSLN